MTFVWNRVVLVARVRDLERRLAIARAKLQLMADHPIGPEARSGLRECLVATEFVRLPDDVLLKVRRRG